MKEIQLTRGCVALVDDEDYEYLNQWKWYLSLPKKIAYATTKVKVSGVRKTVSMHRLIMNVTDRNKIIDHKDGDGLNNQKDNLRECTYSENNSNMRSHAGSSSKYVGVCYCNSGNSKGVWDSSMRIGNKVFRFGRYKTEEEAVLARDRYIIDNGLMFQKLNILKRQ